MNGRYDLINLFAARLDLKPFIDAWGCGGAFTWPIPVGWRCRGEDCEANIICNHNQRFELTSDGTSRIIKMGCVAGRGTNEYLKVTRSQ